MPAEEFKRLKTLELENSSLKNLLAEAEFDKEMPAPVWVWNCPVLWS